MASAERLEAAAHAQLKLSRDDVEPSRYDVALSRYDLE
jgi:hypothetical protein